MKWFESIIAISDLQMPFHHRHAFDFLNAVKKVFYVNERRTKIINQGDEVDQHTLGRWGANPDGLSAGDELKAAQLHFKTLIDLFPEQDFCISNHTWRGFKRAKDAGLPSAFIKDIADILGAPKSCRWAQTWIYNQVVFEHGEKVSGPNAAMNAATQNGMSTSIGHQHSWGGVKYIQRQSGLIFGLNTGCLIDINQYAFEYMRTSRQKPVLGCGVILDNIAHFIPMILDEGGNWIGELRY